MESATQNPTKARAFEIALRALRAHIDVQHATAATLGGIGFDLPIFAQFGITEDRCWIIERDHRRVKALLARERTAHHFLGELRTFADRFHEVAPSGVIDVFHWDICETAEQDIGDLHAILPLVVASTSRCCIVTEADQRGHHALRETAAIDAWWAWLLGEEPAQAFRAHLEDAHAWAQANKLTKSNPRAAATRERSLLLHVLLACSDLGSEPMDPRRRVTAVFARTRRWKALDAVRVATVMRDVGEPRVRFVPEAAARIVYFSARDGERNHFRMRTVGFRLARNDDPIALRDAARRVADGAMRSTLQFVGRDEGSSRAWVVDVPAYAQAAMRAGACGVSQTAPDRMTRRTEEPMKQAAKSSAGTPTAAEKRQEEAHAQRVVEKVVGAEQSLAASDTLTIATHIGVRIEQLVVQCKAIPALRPYMGPIHALSQRAVDALTRLAGLEHELHSVAAMFARLDHLTLEDPAVAPASEPATPPVLRDPKRAPRRSHAKRTQEAKRAAKAPRIAPAPAQPQPPPLDEETKDERIRLPLLRAKAEGQAAYAAATAAIATEFQISKSNAHRIGLGASAKTARGPYFARRCLARRTVPAEREALAKELERFGYGPAKQLLKDAATAAASSTAE